MGFFRASLSMLSAHQTHALFQLLSWPGDSGASLLLHEGLLVGIHLAVLNFLTLLFLEQKSIKDMS